ncbi:hypothetical protein WIS52_02505 [Pseudonocardia nematodicida]|uniref:Integral membrane protein n=1 Tax=Pseudonocardia nematodicida TaxID=1206997 RepID=A0ABV1K4G0_9PSEU
MTLEATGIRVLPLWMLVAFVVTFVATRVVTRMIREGRGPFRDTSVGGVHLHHEVYGIFLILLAGTAQFTWQPGPPWDTVLAVLFGIGAALTLDEFALWLHLDDVYWGPEGRRSVDAVLVAAVLGLLLVLGADPFDDDPGSPAWAVAVSVVVGLAIAVLAILKGRPVLGLTGVLFWPLAVVGALRLARPGSPWARRFYRAGSRRARRAERRFPPGRRTRWDRVVDLFAVVPARDPGAAPRSTP